MQGVRARRLFLTWARPAAPAAVLCAYAVVYAIDRSSAVRTEMEVLVLSVAAAGGYRLLARRFGDLVALRIALPVDTLLIAGMTLAVGDPELVAVAYFWSIGIAAFLLGPRDTLANGALATICAAAVPYLSSSPVNEVAHVTDAIVLALLTGLLAFMAQQAAAARRELEIERDYESAALRIAERIHSSVGLDDLLLSAVEELRGATGASRVVLRLAQRRGEWPPLVEATRPDLEPLAFAQTPAPVTRLWTTREPVVIHDTGEADPELGGYLRTIGTRALIGFPVRWQERTLAIIGVHDDRPRRWTRRGVALLERVVPQLAAAIAQAELIEQQQDTLERLEELTRLREELVANVSHELRTPLTSTIGFLQTLERTDLTLDEEQRRSFVTIARREAERLSRLVQDLLELTRFEHGRVALRMDAVRVRELAERARERVRAAAHVRLDVDDDLTVHGDEDRLLQVLTNLVDNATRHGDGTVTLRGRGNGGSVQLAVTDQGPGVPPEAEGSLFEPFARWSSSDGTGLGLAISRRIVEAHGGVLRYERARPGRDHAFVVELPADAPVHADIPPGALRHDDPV